MKYFATSSLLRTLALLALIESASARPALAAWPHDPNNGNVALCTAAGDQRYPTIASDGAGGTIVTWYDQRSGNYDIYAQRVNAAGVPQWTANGVALCTAGFDQYDPKIVSDGAGGAIVTWWDNRSGTSYDIYAQRVSAAGVPQWTANGVALSTAANDQQYSMIVSDGSGGAIITWQDFRSGTNIDIYAQRVNSTGAPQWTANGVALCTAANNQEYPTIATDGSGGAIVTWLDYRSATNYDIYAQRVNAAGAPQWTVSGVALCTAANNQLNPTIASDGSGGAIATWHDNRNGVNLDIYAQRVTGAGVPQWTAGGVALCTAADHQYSPTIASDGAGGAIVTWYDYRNGTNSDIYAQRVNAGGAPQWTANGVALCTAADYQSGPTIASDGSGGAIVSWFDYRSGISFDIYAQRVTGAGVPQWAADGAAICTGANAQLFPTIVSDGAGGAIVTWQDARSGNIDIYSQRIERFGYLGNPEPSIVNVRDVLNDQGGKVSVEWYASYLDADPDYLVGSYWIWRQAPRAVALAALDRGARLESEGGTPANSPHGLFRTTRFAAQDYIWEYVASQPAQGFSGYSFLATTIGDSTAAMNPRTHFMVEARAAASNAFWNSAPDSGYSVDNIPPSAPAPFTGAYSAGATHLHWGVNHEGDLAGYRLYRGSSSSFVPGPGNLVSAQPDTGFTDVGAAGSWYKLSAVDIHGNESVYAILGPNGTLDAPGPSVTALYFAPPSPNPSSRGTTFRFGLPREGAVTLTLFDQQGRRVREITRGVRPAGENRLQWDGRDEAGHLVPSGLYFAKLDHAGRSLTVRLLAIH